MILPKKDREERAIRRFLDHYNQVNGTSYIVEKWLDRPSQIGQYPQGKTPECLCTSPVSRTEIVIECTMLTGEQDLELTQFAEKFLADVRTQLSCKLPGVFFLYDWEVNAIRCTAKNRKQKIDEFCRAILKVAPTLADGEEASLYQPFTVKLRKEEASKAITNSALGWVSPEVACPHNDEKRLDQQLRKVLDEATKKFTSYADKETVLLMNIWETGLSYEGFETELFQGIDMGKYSNIKHIYLSDGLPDPPIYHLWSKGANI